MEYECPVPYAFCGGHISQVEPRNRFPKIHKSQKEVQRCIRKWLLKEGYEAHSNREFYKEGEPVIVVSKKSGMRLRMGKEKTRFQSRYLNAPVKAL